MRRLGALNPQIRLVSHSAALDKDSLDAAVAAVDLVLDCTDNFATREAVNVACVRAGKPLVSGAAIRLEGQLSVFDTRRDESPCYHCLYGHGSEAELTCSEAGVIGPLVGLVGSLQALEALSCWPVSANRWWAACCWWTPSARASANCGCVAILPVPSVGNAMAVESAAVGVFDSGVGGLSVLREIRARLPSESLLYVADNAHVPYGEKSAEYIRERCERIGDFPSGAGAPRLWYWPAIPRRLRLRRNCANVIRRCRWWPWSLR